MEFTLPPGAFAGPNCGVTAVAIAAGVSMSKAWNLFTANYTMSSNWRGGTRHNERLTVLDQLNVTYREFKSERMTLTAFAANTKGDDKTYMVTTTGHVQMLRNGQVLDQRGVVPVGKHWGRRKFINKPVLEIITPKVDLNAQVFGLPLFDRLT
jgi:hypothetical protein